MPESNHIHTVRLADWKGTCSQSEQENALHALEGGQVLYFPNLAFELAPCERQFLTPTIVDGAKNVSFNPATKKLGGCNCTDGEGPRLVEMFRRFAASAKTLLEGVVAAYCGKLSLGRSSLRPVEIVGRTISWRKDDTRLHVDTFPSTPVQGRRILRVFSNVNPEGKPRSWRLGEPFEDAARRFARALRKPFPGSAALLQLFRVTRSRRTAYDHYMLQMHDNMKADMDYQRTCRQFHFDFPAGSTWAVFTDQVLHAATAGQHQLEQTFYLSVQHMAEPARSPLQILERLMASELTT